MCTQERHNCTLTLLIQCISTSASSASLRAHHARVTRLFKQMLHHSSIGLENIMRKPLEDFERKFQLTKSDKFYVGNSLSFWYECNSQSEGGKNNRFLFRKTRPLKPAAPNSFILTTDWTLWCDWFVARVLVRFQQIISQEMSWFYWIQEQKAKLTLQRICCRTDPHSVLHYMEGP